MSIYGNWGVGLKAGVGQLGQIKMRSNRLITINIHLPGQADPVAEVCDMLQIPAFL
jgi:2-dehydro-3-deoxyphosphooctonate aldolase (KDO 8-P synthase)